MKMHFPSTIKFFKNMLIELVGGNYAIDDGLFNGAKSSLSTIQKGRLIFYGLTSNIQQFGCNL